MGTSTRPELSSRNKYYVERHRYYELKHFCLQYSHWKREWAELDGFRKDLSLSKAWYTRTETTDPTEEYAEKLILLSNRIDLVEKAATLTDEILAPYILLAVTEDLSYEKLRARHNVPCSRDIYYELYRKFFWILDKTRN